MRAFDPALLARGLDKGRRQLASRFRPRDLRWRSLATLGACVALLVACNGGDDEDDDAAAAASREPCGAPAGDWVYLLSCDSTFAGLVHMCTDYYATKSAADASKQSFTALCTALSGKVLSGVCPAAGSIGSCVNTATSSPSGNSPVGALSQVYIYDTSTSAASYQADCEDDNGVYVAADGTAPNLPAGRATQACESGGNGSGNGADLFSMSVYVNGEVMACTNYVGHVTQAELDSVIAIGAETTPCPAANAICSCGVADGTFGTEATITYYETSMSSDTTCPNSDSACVDGYKAP